MKAAFLKGPKKLIVQDTADPKPKPDQVVVKVKCCGICGSDLHAYEFGFASGYIMGHEFSGDIESVGESVKDWKIGDRVTVNPNIACGTCYYCRRGETNLCTKLVIMGFQSHGAFAERVAVHANRLVKLPSNVSYEEGANVEPLATPLRAVKYALRRGDTALVIGAGPIGLFALQISKRMGAKRIYVTETSPRRTEAARKLGADDVFNPVEVKVVPKMIELTQGLGPDVVFECVGRPETVQNALSIVRKAGKAMIVGQCIALVPTDYNNVFLRETEIKGIYAYSLDDFAEALSLVEKRDIDVSSMITDRIALSEIVEKGFGELLKPEKNHIKILVDPLR